MGALPIYIVLVFAGILYNGISAPLTWLDHSAGTDKMLLSSDYGALHILWMEPLLGLVYNPIREALLPGWDHLFHWLHR